MESATSQQPLPCTIMFAKLDGKKRVQRKTLGAIQVSEIDLKAPTVARLESLSWVPGLEGQRAMFALGSKISLVDIKGMVEGTQERIASKKKNVVIPFSSPMTHGPSTFTTLSSDLHTSAVRELAFNAKFPGLVVSGGEDNSVKIWSLVMSGLGHSSLTKHHSFDVGCAVGSVRWCDKG